MMTLFEIIFLIGTALSWLIRVVYAWGSRESRRADRRALAPEWPQLALVGVTLFLLPVVSIFTPWLRFADYRLPAWAGWGGAVLLAGALLLLWRAHADLGRAFSPAVVFKPDHPLVTHGVYRWMRHPMYAAFWLWALAQPLLLWNWLAGWGLLPAYALLYFLRVPREERLLLEHFGDSYHEYMARTGRVWPRRQ